MGLFDWFRTIPESRGASDQQFATLLVEHALTAADECMIRFLYADNCEGEVNALLMYENLFTIYLALVFACLREFEMMHYEDLIVKDLRRRFPSASSAQATQTAANIYRVRDYLHPPARGRSLEESKSQWPLLIRSMLYDYHRAWFGEGNYLAIVDERKTAELLSEHVARVEAHCRALGEGR